VSSAFVTDYREVQNRAFPNTFKNDKWLLTFSNIPGLPDMSEMRYFDAYIKSFTMPDYNLEMINVESFGFNIRHPLGGMKANTQLSQLQVEFKVSEDMLNYLTVFKWMRDIRYGEIDTTRSDLLRLYVCEVATLTMMDNKKRSVADIKFTKLLPASLSSLPLTMGSSEEVSFTVNFTYEELKYDLKDPMIGGANPTAPETISPCGVSAQPLSTSATWSK
jgi:hypothetical protein